MEIRCARGGKPDLLRFFRYVFKDHVTIRRLELHAIFDGI